MRRCFLGLFFVLIVAGCASQGDAAQTSEDEIIASAIEITDSVVDFRSDDFITQPGIDGLDLENYRVTMNTGPREAARFEIAVPAGWIFDESTVTFSDGESTISVLTGCVDDCSATDWLSYFSMLEFGDNGRPWMVDAGLEPPNGGTFFGGGGSRNSERVWFGYDLPAGGGLGSAGHFRLTDDYFVRCDVDIAPDSNLSTDHALELCREVEVDWSSLASSVVDFEAPNTTSPETQALLDSTSATSIREVPVDHSGRTVSIALSDGALVTQRDPSSMIFSTESEVDLPTAASIFTDLTLASRCGVFCEPQYWEETLNEPSSVLAKARSRLGPIESDTRIESGWILMGQRNEEAESVHMFEVLVLRFDNAVDRFFECRAEIAEEDAGLRYDIAEICLSANPSWID